MPLALSHIFFPGLINPVNLIAAFLSHRQIIERAEKRDSAGLRGQQHIRADGGEIAAKLLECDADEPDR